MRKDKIGKGIKIIDVNNGLTVIILETIKTIKVTKFKVYITAGPKYMRTLVTSSVILFNKSPELFCL